MGNNFLIYAQRLEMMAFFSGYPLIYFLLRLIARNTSFNNRRGNALTSILPWSYALVGTLYLGLQLNKLYPDYTIENSKQLFFQPGLQIWSLLSLLFWIPTLSKKQIWTVLHSLIFFFLIIKDLFFYFTRPGQDRDIVKNDMSMYTVSLLLNLAAVTFLFLLNLLFGYRKNNPES